MVTTSPEPLSPSSSPLYSDGAAVGLAAACIAAFILMRHSWGNGNDGNILAPTQFKTRTMQHHCVGGETEMTKMKATGGKKRGGRRNGGSATKSALSGDSILYWETLVMLMQRVALERTNTQGATFPHAPQRWSAHHCAASDDTSQQEEPRQMRPLPPQRNKIG
jgi:hypothetical protein